MYFAVEYNAPLDVSIVVVPEADTSPFCTYALISAASLSNDTELASSTGLDQHRLTQQFVYQLRTTR